MTISSIPAAPFRHLQRLTDNVGVLERADGIVPRYDHGYRVDDVACGLVVVCRQPSPSAELITLGRRYLYFLAQAQAADGKFRNRLGDDRRWRGKPEAQDAWGRSLWALGTAAARGPTAGIRAEAGVVSRWRKRFAEEGMSGLADRQRSGRPRIYAAAVVAEVKAMACEPPEDRGVPQSRWSAADLAAQAAAGGLVEAVSRATVARWLDGDAIRPWRYRSWIFPRDPDFAAKAGRVLDLHQRIWDGAELDEDEYVISTDEKSQLQILSRRHPG
ncbi:MAG TPA: helix-turn-helix domain-containing protein, partial [Streptosporangiaceae bacterium]|nr:helix-turn-helix domain-containing protein [Streptosporangiaceae bacterium]